MLMDFIVFLWFNEDEELLIVLVFGFIYNHIPNIQAISKYVHVIFYLREWILNLIKHHIIKARQNADYQCNVILYQCEKDMTTFPKYWNWDLIEVWLAKRVQSLSYA